MKKSCENSTEKKQALEKTIKRLASEQQRKQKSRLAFKRTIDEVSADNPAVGKRLKKHARQQIGRPSLEDDQPELLKTIVDITCVSAGADARRHSEMLTCCKTLDDLHEKLLEHGFSISRSGTYFRFLPRNSTTMEGKRHVTTVPIKLVRAANSARKEHADAHFAAATIAYMKDLATMMGKKCVFFLSQDNKARVLLGMTVANKQSPILMH